LRREIRIEGEVIKILFSGDFGRGSGGNHDKRQLLKDLFRGKKCGAFPKKLNR